jgi:hypothetical protein
VEELSLAVDNLQVYYNTLHEEVHVLYSQLHPNVPANPVGMEAGPSHVAGEALDGELDLFRLLPLCSWLSNGLLRPTVKLPKVKKMAYQVPVTLAGRNFPTNMIILKGQDIDIILGINWLVQQKAVLNTDMRTIRLSYDQ